MNLKNNIELLRLKREKYSHLHHICIFDLLFVIFSKAPTEFPLAYRVKLPIKSMSYEDLPV